MKNIINYKLFESDSTRTDIPIFSDVSDLDNIFNLLMSNISIHTIPYSYYGDPKTNKDFNIYVIYGDRVEMNEHELLREIYHNHEILNEIYNIEIYHIGLTKENVIITLYDYVNTKNYYFNTANKNYLGKIPEKYFSNGLPSPVFNKMKIYFYDNHTRNLSSGRYLSSGINYSELNTDNPKGSGNVSLFKNKYGAK